MNQITKEQINVENINWNDIKSLSDIVEIVGDITTPSNEKANKIVNIMREKMRDYIKNSGLKSLVIGISGGLDSSVTAALFQEKYTGIPLIGISIPMSSSIAHKEQAQWIGDNYCTAFEEFQGWDESWELSGAETEGQGGTSNMITEVFNTTKMTDKLAQNAGFKPTEFPINILEGNIKARLRMITLYDLARKTNGMVLSTDNLSEFQMGFWTICGDVGDFGSIQNVGKGFELPAIAEALNIRKDIIYQAPSDGLMVTEENTDEAQLGANYKEVDTIMGIYLKSINTSETVMSQLIISMNNISDISDKEKINNIINRYKMLTYKRNGTVNLTRNEVGLD
jgi:nicotinamide-nucleotide amidase